MISPNQEKVAFECEKCKQYNKYGNDILLPVSSKYFKNVLTANTFMGLV